MQGWFTDDTPGRFEAYGWHVISAVDGHDAAAVEAALLAAKAESTRPTLVCCKTVIGKEAPISRVLRVAGAALGEDEILTCEALQWPHAPLEVPEDIRGDGTAAGKFKQEAMWQTRFDAYRGSHPDLADEFLRRLRGNYPPILTRSRRLYQRLRGGCGGRSIAKGFATNAERTGPFSPSYSEALPTAGSNCRCGRAPRGFPPGMPPAIMCTTACASSRWLPS